MKKDGYQKNIIVNISFSSVIKMALFVVLLYLLFFLRDLVLVFLTAIVLASAIEPIIKRLGRLKMPRVLAVTLVYFILILLIS